MFKFELNKYQITYSPLKFHSITTAQQLLHSFEFTQLALNALTRSRSYALTVAASLTGLLVFSKFETAVAEKEKERQMTHVVEKCAV